MLVNWNCTTKSKSEAITRKNNVLLKVYKWNNFFFLLGEKLSTNKEHAEQAWKYMKVKKKIILF